MNKDFPRILTLLREERGLSQKQVAADLEISQPLLSHYEKGIRECGLEFVVRAAEYYDVSCDYILGRSANRKTGQIVISDIPEPEGTAAALSKTKSGMINALNKKLIFNSLSIVFDDSGTTGIKAVHGDDDDSWYTIDGRKLDQAPSRKGLYIRGGRKVVRK